MAHPGIGPGGNTPRDRYDGEVTFTDRYVGKLLDFIAAQPWGARTAIVVTADHGEAFGEHRQYMHGFELWENLVRSLLLLRCAGRGSADHRHSPQRNRPRSHVPRPVRASLQHTRRRRRPRSSRERASSPRSRAGKPPRATSSSISPRQRQRPAPRPRPRDDQDPSRSARACSRSSTSPPTPDREAHRQGRGLRRDARPLPGVRKTVKDVAPTRCKEGCLNGAYAKKDGGD